MLHSDRLSENNIHLPEEMWLEILKYLEYEKLSTIRTVSRSFDKVSLKQIFLRTEPKAILHRKLLLKRWSASSNKVSIKPLELLRHLKLPDYSVSDRINILTLLSRKARIEIDIPSHITDELFTQLNHDEKFLLLNQADPLLNQHEVLFRAFNAEQINELYYQAIGELSARRQNDSSLSIILSLALYLDDHQLSDTIELLAKNLKNSFDLSEIASLIVIMWQNEKHAARIFEVLMINIESFAPFEMVLRFFMPYIRENYKKLNEVQITMVKGFLFSSLNDFDENSPKDRNFPDLFFEGLIDSYSDSEINSLVKIIYKNLSKAVHDENIIKLIDLLIMFLPRLNCAQSMEGLDVIIKIVQKSVEKGRREEEIYLDKIKKYVAALSVDNSEYIINPLVEKLSSNAKNITSYLIQLNHLVSRIHTKILPSLISSLQSIIRGKHNNRALCLYICIMPMLDSEEFNKAFDIITTKIKRYNIRVSCLLLSVLSPLSDTLSENQLTYLHGLLITMLNDIDSRAVGYTRVQKELLISSTGNLINSMPSHNMNYLLQVMRGEIEGIHWREGTIYNILNAISHQLEVEQIKNLATYAFLLKDPKKRFLILSVISSMLEPADFTQAVTKLLKNLLNNKIITALQSENGISQIISQIMSIISSNIHRLEDDQIKLIVGVILTNLDSRFLKESLLLIIDNLLDKLSPEDLTSIGIIMLSVRDSIDEGAMSTLYRIANVLSKENINPLLSKIISNLSCPKFENKAAMANLISYLIVNNKCEWEQLQKAGINEQPFGMLIRCVSEMYAKVNTVNFSFINRHSIFQQRSLPGGVNESSIDHGINRITY